ncbi:hypothetical protein EJ07DRAFT_157016 [Lizonia empirigonia]|nr:hypothetical protein EJ07DRAFT_157016 [Lizonia empirigonia]
MQFSIIATIAVLSATVLGQSSLANIPTCARLMQLPATITFAQTLCTGAGVTLNTSPDCGAVSSSASASASAASSASSSASAAASRSASSSRSASVTAISGTNTPSGSATGTPSQSGTAGAASTGGAAFQTAGPVVGLGLAIIGMLAAL